MGEHLEHSATNSMQYDDASREDEEGTGGRDGGETSESPVDDLRGQKNRKIDKGEFEEKQERKTKSGRVRCESLSISFMGIRERGHGRSSQRSRYPGSCPPKLKATSGRFRNRKQSEKQARHQLLQPQVWNRRRCRSALRSARTHRPATRSCSSTPQ